MTINRITGSGLPIEGPAPRKPRETRSTEKRDSVELSGEARSLFAANQDHRIEAIQEKIAGGFYNSPEALEKVADAILNDIDTLPPAR